MSKTVDALYQKLTKTCEQYLDNKSLEKIKKAYTFAKSAHAGQYRCSKKPYITHPVEVAIILAELQQSAESIIAGLLHDTIEDTKVSLLDINDQFGEKIGFLVEGITKLNKLQFHSREEAQAENYRRMFLAMADDYHVLIIKLVDRLHNLRTLQFLKEEKQKRIAKESLDIYAPLAHRLGIGDIKEEIEDLSFFYLHPEDYHQIKELIDMNKSEQDAHVKAMIKELKSLLNKHSIKAEISGRAKQVYSIYRKIHLKKIPFNKLYDIFGLRILVDSVDQCYAALGIIHNIYKPIPNRFKDYIALPKPNGYQSLHTTIVGPKGTPTEVQIRTVDMEHSSKFGLSAHWEYKTSDKRKKGPKELDWIKHIVEENEDLAPLDYLQSIKDDLFMDDIFVFTPKGDVKVLAKGSTALDFAYAIHTEVGHCCKGCLVNGEIVTLDYELRNGDRVEVLQNKTAAPKLDWLQIVQSRHSRLKIKQWLNKQNKDVLIEQGKKRLEKACTLEGLELSQCLKQIPLTQLKDRFHLSELNDLFLYIEQGDLPKKEVLRYFSKELEHKEEPELLIKKRGTGTTCQDGIQILGEKNISFTLARCCNPLPGDDISGVTVINKGISIHRSDCMNMVNIREKFPERILEVSWDKDSQNNQCYACTISVEGYDRQGILQDILRIIYDSDVTLNEVNTKVDKDKTKMKAVLKIAIKDVKEFYDIKSNLMAIPDIYSVSRVSLGFK